MFVARDHFAKSRLLGAQVFRKSLRRTADRNRAELPKTFGDLRLAQMYASIAALMRSMIGFGVPAGATTTNHESSV